jgi:hypothetical protein
MTAQPSLISRKSGAHRAPLQRIDAVYTRHMILARRKLLLILAIAFLLFRLSIKVKAQTDDAYAIYSDLIAKTPVVRSGAGNVPTDDQIYLIDGTTIKDRDGYGPPGARSLFTAEACMKVPPVDDAGFREILGDYNLRKNTPAALKRQFTFSKPYQLLSSVEADRFLREALESNPKVKAPNVTPPPNKNPLYQKSKRVFRLGDVYFNISRTLAVVFFSVYTTPQEGTGSWRAFRKAANGQWQTNNAWSTCAWSTSR